MKLQEIEGWTMKKLHTGTDAVFRSHWKYFLWAVPLSVVLLWPLTWYIGRIDELGSAGPAAAVPVAAFSLGMAACLLSAPLFYRGGAIRLLSADLGILSAPMGMGLAWVTLIYLQSISLAVGFATTGSIGTVLAAWSIRARNIPPEKPALLAVTAVLNMLVLVGLGRIARSMIWNG